jgi:hypothetical protein
MKKGEIAGWTESLRAAISKRVGRYVLAKTIWRTFTSTIKIVTGGSFGV